MYKLLATDIDDTLLASDGSLPPANRVALLKLHRAGVAVVFCSGRADVSIQAVARTILPPADDEFLIAYNGARIVTADTRRVIAEHNVSAAALARVLEYARSSGLYVQAYADDLFLVERETDRTRAYARSTGMEFRVVPDLIDALPNGSPKLIVIDDHDLLVHHAAELRSLAATMPDAGFEAMFSKPTYLEIVRPGVNKGAAIVDLALRLGIPIEQTVAVGDSGNDVEMIRAAGLGLAVANAREEARAAADVVLETDADGGVMAEVLERFFPETA